MAEEFTPRSNFPYLIGVYLAVNAMPDTWLYVDGPDCTHYKAQFIHGKHDLQSTLVDAAGNHRIRMSDVTVNRIVEDRSQMLREGLLAMDREPHCALSLLTSMPMATITGTQYDLLVRSLQDELSGPLLEVPGLSLSGDWLDGYSETLTTLARGLELPVLPVDPDKVAVVGYLMDRTERDHLANVEEIERLLTGMGLAVSSFWLSNRPVSHLAKVAEAGTLLALPHGRKAAEILAERTGARVVELGLPCGFQPTIAWLTDVGVATGREEEAARLVEAELAEWIPRIQWLVEKYFVGTRVFFSGEPHLVSPFVEFMRELGSEVVAAVAVGRPVHLDPVPDTLARSGIPLLFQPNPYELQEVVGRLDSDSPFDIAVQSDTFGWRGRGDFVTVPLGCASYWWHAIADAPFLGFAGAVSLVDRMANRLMAHYRQSK